MSMLNVSVVALEQAGIPGLWGEISVYLTLHYHHRRLLHSDGQRREPIDCTGNLRGAWGRTGVGKAEGGGGRKVTRD